ELRTRGYHRPGRESFSRHGSGEATGGYRWFRSRCAEGRRSGRRRGRCQYRPARFRRLSPPDGQSVHGAGTYAGAREGILKVSGSYTLPFERERVYHLLQDPDVLAQCMPGTDHLAKIGPDEYEMKMKMVISAVQGLFAGKIRVADQKPPEQFRLLVEGSGKVGFLKGEGVLRLVQLDASPSDTST